jgi:hypothetical protein
MCDICWQRPARHLRTTGELCDECAQDIDAEDAAGVQRAATCAAESAHDDIGF